jgi:hypothetical protein
VSLTTVVHARGEIILTDEQDQYPLGLHFEILEDKEGILTIEDVTSPEIAAEFVPSQEEAPSFGLSDSAKLAAHITALLHQNSATQNGGVYMV